MPSPLMAERERFAWNLLRLYRQATDSDLSTGRQWYPNAADTVHTWADLHGKTPANIAAVIAVLSPQCEWTRNKTIAAEMLLDGYPTISGALGVNVDKARRVIDEGIEDTRVVMPTGLKVHNFSLNLAGDYSHVTVDQHMIEAAWDDHTYKWYPKPAGYVAYSDAVVLAADEAAESPALFQSVVWHVWKRLHPTGSKRVQRARFNAQRRAA